MNPAEFQNIAAVEQEMWWFRGMREILNAFTDEEVRRRKIDKALEGGCGTGFNTLHLGRRYGWQVYPVDLSPVGLAHASRYGVDRATCANIAALPFPGASMDAVFSLDVLVHFERGAERKALAEMHRVLKPGGLFLLRTSALEILRSRHSEFCDERQRFSHDELVGLVRQAGFRILKSTYANSFLFPVALFRFRVWEPLTNQPPQTGVVLQTPWLEKLLYAPLRLEAACIRRGIHFPVGQSILILAEKEK